MIDITNNVTHSVWDSLNMDFQSINVKMIFVFCCTKWFLLLFVTVSLDFLSKCSYVCVFILVI